MTAKELYAMTPESVTRSIDPLAGCYYNHVPEIEELYERRWGSSPVSGRMEIRFVKHVNYDERRYWRLATVWFDDQPVMVIQNAGREGDDHARRFITDPARYRELSAHLFTLRPVPVVSEPSAADVIDPTEDRQDLDFFYEQGLSGPFFPY